MTYLLDTDHISILQRQSGPEFATLMAHIAQQAPTELAFSIISMHEQVLGCHTYTSRARTTNEVVRGYRMLAQILQDFAVAPVLPFDAATATVFDGLAAQGVRIGREVEVRLHLNQPIEANPFAIPPPSAPKMPRRLP